MTTMYRVDSYSQYVTPVEVVKETEKTVVINSSWGQKGARREDKQSMSHFYGKTFDDAKRWLVERHQNRVNSYRHKLECAIRDLAIVEEIKP